MTVYNMKMMGSLILVFSGQILVKELRMYHRVDHQVCDIELKNQNHKDLLADVIQVDQQSIYRWYKSDQAIEQIALYQEPQGSSLFLLRLCEKNRIVGYVFCQYFQADCHVIIRQLMLDVQEKQHEWLEKILLVCADLNSCMQQLSIFLFESNAHLGQNLKNLGFDQVIKQASSLYGLQYECYQMKFQSKCMMCEILYGPDFWMQECNDGVCQDALNQEIVEYDDSNDHEL